MHIQLLAIIASALLFFSAISGEDKKFEKEISFGNPSSHITLYIFSDWLCKPCQKHEMAFQGILDKFFKIHQIVYVDIVVHKKTLPFVPYNISFMLNNKANYLKIRELLMQFATSSKIPISSEIDEFIQQENIPYEEVDEKTVEKGKLLFGKLLQKFSVDRTPTVVVANTTTHQFQKLIGTKEITEANLEDAIKSLEH